MSSLETIYLFRHAAVRDVVYSLHLPSTRAELHCTAFDVLEQEFAGRTETVANELAEHARCGREGLTGPASTRLAEAEFKYLLESNRRHNARAQWDQVVDTAHRALATTLGTPSERRELQGHMAVSLGLLGRRAEVHDAALELHRMGKDAGDVRAEHAGLSLAALNKISMGDHLQGEKLLQQALEIADARGGVGMRAKARMEFGMLHITRGEAEMQEAYYSEALAILGDSVEPIRWPLLGNLANLYSGTGRITEAIKQLREIIDEVSTHAEVDVHGLQLLSTAQVNLARQYLLLDDLERAEQQFQEAITASARTGRGSTAAFANANLAEIYLRRGEFERASDTIARALDGAREQGLPLYHAAYQCTLAQLQLLSGHEASAAELVEDARAEFMAVGGEAFVDEYCGIIRLRIAASQAVSMRVQGRATSQLKAAPPASAWLPVIRELAAQIRRAEQGRAGRASSPLSKAANDAQALAAELDAAAKDRRPALIFRGHLPGEMLPGLRRALRERLGAGEAQLMQRMQPELWQALGA